MINNTNYKRLIIVVSIISILGSLIYLYFNLHFIFIVFKLGFNSLKIAVENTRYTANSFLILVIFSTFFNLLLFTGALGLLKYSENARKIVILCLTVGICWEIIEYIFVEKKMILEDLLQYLYLVFSFMILTNNKAKKIFLSRQEKCELKGAVSF